MTPTTTTPPRCSSWTALRSAGRRWTATTTTLGTHARGLEPGVQPGQGCLEVLVAHDRDPPGADHDRRLPSRIELLDPDGPATTSGVRQHFPEKRREARLHRAGSARRTPRLCASQSDSGPRAAGGPLPDRPKAG